MDQFLKKKARNKLKICIHPLDGHDIFHAQDLFQTQFFFVQNWNQARSTWCPHPDIFLQVERQNAS